jgi:4-amino-4-deoxy-L-arabinose transferase-like glycosyltransferase
MRYPHRPPFVPARRGLVLLLLISHGAMLGFSSIANSPTLNEPGHLAAGVSYLTLGRFELYRVNPPLVRMLAALPATIVGAQTDWGGVYEGPGARPIYNVGLDFARANGPRIFWLIVLGRLACIPFSILGGFVVYRWASELYGSQAGLASLVLWCICPNVLAHGPLITPDMGATALGVTTAYVFWRWLQESTWRLAISAGVVLGVAQLTKMTLLVFVPLWPILWVTWRATRRTKQLPFRGLSEVSQLTCIVLISIYVINLGYGFEGSGERLGKLPFVSRAFTSADGENRFANTALGYLPVPLPRDYLLGMDTQKRDLEGLERPSYLKGEFRSSGWWYYYLFGLLVKVPLGTWFLFVSTLALRVIVRDSNSRWRDEVILLTPALAILILVSSQSGFSEHFRYALPIFPFALIWTGQSFSICKSNKWRIMRACCILWSVTSSLWIYPHSISYFNELVGGPREGQNYMLVSSLDWGQDLLYLQSWLHDHPKDRPFFLAYYGEIDPHLIDIEYELPPFSILENNQSPPHWLRPGWYAVSVNFVMGYPWRVFDGDGSQKKAALNAYSYFLQFKPVAMAGYSICIYHITEDDIIRANTDVDAKLAPGET